jgi:3-hydroxymyristoyl/3-hydroxydecanoyl-(acyl carrier protein) dehydratase
VAPLGRLLIDQCPVDLPVAFGAQGLPRDWNAFHTDVKSLCARLARLGGSRWLIAEDDAYGLAVSVFATLHAGGQAVLPANLQSGHLADLASTVDGVIADAASLPDGIDAIPLFDTGGDDEGMGLAPLDNDSAKIVLHTSGTTGKPLAIHKPLRCLDAEVSALEATFGDRLSGVAQGGVYATVPAYHIYGLLFRVLWPVAVGRPLGAGLISYPEQLVSSATDKPLSILVSSPAFLKRARPVLDLDHLKAQQCLVFSSGGLLPPNIAASYNAELSQPIVEVYGSTETGGIGYRSVTDAENPPDWVPLPGVNLSIDPDTKVLAVKSPFIPTADWFLTGDLAQISEGGCFKLGGRADRIVKLEELRVSLGEMEDRLGGCPEVDGGVVFALAADEGARQSLGAVVRLSFTGWKFLADNGKQAITEALSAALKPYFSATALPRKWRFVRQIPENERGKTTQAALNALFTDNQGQATEPVVVHKEVTPVAAVLRLQLPPDLLYFEGHFDAEPILAGVVQIDWAIGFAIEFFPITGTFKRMEAVKFFKVLFADQEVTLDLRYDADRGRLNFRYLDGETKISAGRVVFEEAA